MPHYLCQVAYRAATIKAQLENPTDRETAARKLVEANGGNFLGMYFTYSKFDAYILFKAPSENMIGIVAILKATGAFEQVELVLLHTGEERQAAYENALSLNASYQSPLA